MSCEFQPTAIFEGISKFLDREASNDDENESEGLRNSFPDFKIAISPTGEIIVFAKKTWMLICGSKWDSSKDGVQIKYIPKCHGHVNCKQGDKITSVLCLPFLSQGQSIQGCADWNCIVVGFSSGCIKFFTETMQELACSILHEESIINIKSHCSLKTQLGKSQKQEVNDIYVLYKSVICILNGSLLYQTLRNKRYDLAKGASAIKSETDDYTPIDFKKYIFTDQDEVTDACFLGQGVSSLLNTFDHLVTTSIVGGFSSNYRSSPPQTSLILTCGRRPFVGFNYTLEGGSSPLLSDVALAVASKIKNSVTAALPDWLGFGSKKPLQSEKPKEVVQGYPEKLKCRFGLCDLWRQGDSVIVSPDGVYSAISDSLGRVILIHNASGVAHRMWKGFRDAQCGFVLVEEDIRKVKRRTDDNLKPQPRQGLFLIIYAPKKGLIEIFNTQNGRRVTHFKVTKFGHLLYIPRINTSGKSFTEFQNQVVFVSEDGLNEFSVPFHYALEDDHSKISRDLHILKKIKMLLKMESNASNPKFCEEIEKCAKDLQTDEVRLQAIESMVTYKNTTLEAFKIMLKNFLEAFENKDRPEPPPRKIVAFAETIFNLLLFYEFLLNLNNCSNQENTVKLDSVSEELRLPQKEVDITFKFISQIKEIEGIQKQTTKVAFEEKKSTKLGQYLSFFDFESFLNYLHKNEKQEEKKGMPSMFLHLKSNLKGNKYNYLGEIFFKGLFASFSCLTQWTQHALRCYLNPTDLALCLVSFWCYKKLPEDFSPEVCFLVEVLKRVCSLNDPNVVSVEYNSESPWWSRLRAFISSNPNTISALLAALCCRSVTIFVEQERELSGKCSSDKKHKPDESSTFNETYDWETISKDTYQWDILIIQLQDLALLNAILNLDIKPQNKPDGLPTVPYDFEYQTLTCVQSKGLGRVSELVAKWMVQFGFQPAILIDKSDLEFQVNESNENEKGKVQLVMEFGKANDGRGDGQNLNLPLEYLKLLKSRFPYSLSSSSLLCNMSWEYVAHWFKNISEIGYLESAVRYLEFIPANRVKYGMSYLSWITYLEQKFEVLAKMIHRLGKVPREKFCFQELGLRTNQVPEFLKLVSEYLKIQLYTDVEEKQELGCNQEAIWQNSKTTASSSSNLLSIALSQPMVNSDFIMFKLQLCYSLLMISGLNVKHNLVFTTLFDIAMQSHHSLQLKHSRKEFLQKVLTNAVETVQIVESIPAVPSEDFPATRLKVDEYKNWLHLCFELAGMWAISVDDLRRHQVCELYSHGFDRLAEEIVPSINETSELASQLLVIGGKRLKYLIQDSRDLCQKLANLSPNLSDWLQTLDVDSFRYQCGNFEDIEIIMQYVIKWLPEGHSDQKLAISIIESIAWITPSNS